MQKSHMKSQAKAQKVQKTKLVTKTTKRKVATKVAKKTAQKSKHQLQQQLLSITAPSFSSMVAPVSSASLSLPRPLPQAQQKKKKFAAIQQMPTFASQNTALFRQTNKQFAEEAKKVKDYFEISIASPNIAPYNKAKAFAVYLTAVHGERGLLRNAAPAIYTLKPGALRVYEEQGEAPKVWFVPTGVARIANDDHALSVTCSELIPIDDLDVDAARKLLDTSTAAVAAATEAADKHKHTVNLRVAQAIVRTVERFGTTKQ